jgi:hypothetical protein
MDEERRQQILDEARGHIEWARERQAEWERTQAEIEADPIAWHDQLVRRYEAAEHAGASYVAKSDRGLGLVYRTTETPLPPPPAADAGVSADDFLALNDLVGNLVDRVIEERGQRDQLQRRVDSLQRQLDGLDGQMTILRSLLSKSGADIIDLPSRKLA